MCLQELLNSNWLSCLYWLPQICYGTVAWQWLFRVYSLLQIWVLSKHWLAMDVCSASEQHATILSLLELRISQWSIGCCVIYRKADVLEEHITYFCWFLAWFTLQSWRSLCSSEMLGFFKVQWQIQRISLLVMFIYFIHEYIVARANKQYRYFKALSQIMLLINLINRTDILSGNFSLMNIFFPNFILHYLTESLPWILFTVLHNFLDQEKSIKMRI
jgi:hypothetical protein